MTTTMKRLALATSAVFVALALAVGCGPRDGMTQRTQGNYASVNGLRVYYEIHGAGRPLVLLHDGYSPKILEGLKSLTPEGLPQELEEDDASAAPDLQQGPTLVAKVAKQAAAATRCGATRSSASPR